MLAVSAMIIPITVPVSKYILSPIRLVVIQSTYFMVPQNKKKVGGVRA